MALPHIKHSSPINPDWEAVTNNYFEVSIIPPQSIANAGGQDIQQLLLKSVQSIGGLDGVNPSVEAFTQKYKFSDRSYPGVPTQTFMDLTLTFTMNLRDITDNYIYNALRAWTKMIYNANDGRMSIGNVYRGQMIIRQADRAGHVWRQITCNRIFPTGQITGLGDLNYTQNEAATLSITFRVDQWDDQTIGDFWNPVNNLPELPDYNQQLSNQG